MGGVSRWLRAKVDYFRFLGAHEWPITVAALGVLLGAVTIVPSTIGAVLSVVALVLGIVTFVRDLRALRGRWAAHDFSAIATLFPRERMPAPAGYPDARYLAVPGRGTGLVSDAIDAALRERDFPVEFDEEPYRLPARLRATAPYVLPLRARGRLLFNGQVVGLRDDPLPSVGAVGAPVRLRRARFFDSECSNELCGMRIVDRATGEEFDPRLRLLADSAGRLRSLAESELADVVGISTLAMTTDGHVVLVVQSHRNTASALLVAPSGSGSLEPKDVAGGLADSVRAGMERELREETGLRPEEIVGTEITGFARWMERGAKPEFFGLTTLSVSSADVAGRRGKGVERLYGSPVLLMPVDLAALGADLRGGADLVTTAHVPERLREDGSLPLLLALRAAALATVEPARAVEPGD